MDRKSLCGDWHLSWVCSLKRGHTGEHEAYPGHDLKLPRCDSWPNPTAPPPERVEALAKHLERTLASQIRPAALEAIRWLTEHQEAAPLTGAEKWEVFLALDQVNTADALSEIRRLQERDKCLSATQAAEGNARILEAEGHAAVARAERDALRRLVLAYRAARKAENESRDGAGCPDIGLHSAMKTTRRALFAAVKGTP